MWKKTTFSANSIDIRINIAFVGDYSQHCINTHAVPLLSIYGTSKNVGFTPNKPTGVAQSEGTSHPLKQWLTGVFM